MKFYKFEEPVKMENDELLKKFKKIKEKVKISKNKYLEVKKYADPNKYDKLLLAKLAFDFAKEEEHSLYNEVKKRALITEESK